MYIVNIVRNRIVKRHTIIAGLVLVLSTFAGFNSCAQMDNVDDQSPVLIVHIVPGAGITISDTNKVYLIFYSDSTWLSPYLQFGGNADMLINPVVNTFSTYVAAFWDADGDSILDAGEPCTGFTNANHSLGNDLTELIFYPLEWREITITLDTTITY
jgi:hypothetical protein